VFEASIGSSLRLYRGALARCWLPSLLLALGWGWIATLLDRKLPSGDDLLLWLAQAQVLVWSGYFWRLVLAAVVLAIFFYSAMVADIYAVATGGATPTGAGLIAALRAFPGAVAATLIFLVGTSIGFAPQLGLLAVLFIFPSAYLWGMWQLWLVVLVVERSGPITALRRSWQLMAGAWWRITTLITVVTLISFLPVLVFDSVASTVLVLLGVEGMHAPPVLTALAIALVVFLLPMVPAALVAAYLDRQRAPVVLG
jgi:hypothetical protein